jgi:hypothetical protein
LLADEDLIRETLLELEEDLLEDTRVDNVTLEEVGTELLHVPNNG